MINQKLIKLIDKRVECVINKAKGFVQDYENAVIRHTLENKEQYRYLRIALEKEDIQAIEKWYDKDKSNLQIHS